MADGGIDAIRDGSIVYQVKWSSKLQQNPDVWLDRTIDRERSKIQRLIREKRIQKYVLITSVAGTTTADENGSTQKLRARLDAYSDEFKIPVECWWQADCQWPIGTARGRPAEMPAGGHGNCPLMANRSAHQGVGGVGHVEGVVV
ncbi:hypothetical protein [Microbacterium lacticum]